MKCKLNADCGYDRWLDRGDPANDPAVQRLDRMFEEVSYEYEGDIARLALESVDDISDLPPELYSKLVETIDWYYKHNPSLVESMLLAKAEARIAAADKENQY